ncbi:glycosyltransferase [Bosea sp. BH3]|uniref:glycosyltransferase n=1 Tax=Bosea sp. BH3 TaxID=2871701 RepID=UPI0021CB0BC8|nr:glycosyltransferase [Bosea sp. BH3]MCU4181122.1 glycosyltransferase [Bosea sp. BH3]
MYKILYIVPRTQSFAGIERVIDSICDEMAGRFGDVLDVHVLYSTAYRQIADADRRYTKIIRTAPGRMNLIRNLRRLIAEEGYDLIVCPQVEPTAMLWFATLGLKRKFAMHLHGNPRLESRSRKSRIMFALMKLFVLKRLAVVLGTSSRQLAAFGADYPSDVRHVWVPNPVRRFETTQPAPRQSDAPIRFVSVGRFDYQKGQDILLRAFAEFSKRRPGAHLSLVGFGNDEPILRGLIEELGLSASVTLEHYPDSPETPLSRSDVFLSGARWEGWSLAICEALRFGLPIVSFDCEFGPSEIIMDDRIGRLIPIGDTAAFVEAMIYYHDNITSERRHAEYRSRHVDRFSIEEVVQLHADALLSAMPRHPETVVTA